MLGAGGFVGLLVASARLPDIADPLRWAALLWFAFAGAIWAFTGEATPRR